VGLLPIWLISGIDAVCDLSGLAGNKELVAGLSRVGWQDFNSDRMQPIQEAVTAEAAQNKVFFNGQEQRIEEHWKEIVRGFSDLHGLIVSPNNPFWNSCLASVPRGAELFFVVRRSTQN
jgi:lantibiotic modifying enzyme